MLIPRFFNSSLLPGCVALAVLAWLAPAGSGAPGESTTLQGILIDRECSVRAETRMVPGSRPHLEGGVLWAYTHTRQCLLMPACQRSGYGVFAFEANRFLPFDANGNQKAGALLAASKKQDDMRVEVVGEVAAGTIKVTSLKLLP